MNNVAGIDISKRKSMVSVLRPFGEVVAKPFAVSPISSERKNLADYVFAVVDPLYFIIGGFACS